MALELNDVLAMKGMGGNAMSPFEQYMVAEKQSKRPSGVGIAGLVLGTVGTAAAIGAWIFGGTYASSKSTQAKEADKIVEAMNPKPVWDKEQLMEGLQKLELPTEEVPYFNDNALYVTVSMVYSDSAKTIANIIGKPLAEIDDDTMMKAIYSLAMDKLKDVDGKFSVRRYFGL